MNRQTQHHGRAGAAKRGNKARGRGWAVALVAALLGPLGAQTAEAGCFRFYNEKASPLNVRFALPNLKGGLVDARCPSGMCWGDGWEGKGVREYCPGPLVSPPPVPLATTNFIVAAWPSPSQNVEFHGTLVGTDSDFTCSIHFSDGGGVTANGCGAARLNRVK